MNFVLKGIPRSSRGSSERIDCTLVKKLTSCKTNSMYFLHYIHYMFCVCMYAHQWNSSALQQKECDDAIFSYFVSLLATEDENGKDLRRKIMLINSDGHKLKFKQITLAYVAYNLQLALYKFFFYIWAIKKSAFVYNVARRMTALFKDTDFYVS